MYTDTEREAKLASINEITKEQLSKESISSKLRKVPNKYKEYLIEFGGLKCSYYFANGYLKVYRLAHTKYCASRNRLDYLLKYFVRIAENFKIPVISVTGMDDLEPLKEIFYRNNFIDSIDTYSAFPYSHNTFLYDIHDGITFRAADIYSQVFTYLESKKEEYEALKFNRISTDALYAFEYYYKGYEGVLEIVHQDNSYFLCDKKIEYTQKLNDVFKIHEYIEEMFELGREKYRLINMLEPSRVHFDHKLSNTFGISSKTSEVIFKYLMNEYEPEEIEEKIINESLNSGKDGNVLILSIFESIFVLKNSYSLDVLCFSFDEKEQAIESFKKIALENIMVEINNRLTWFISKLEKKIKNDI